MSIQRKPKTDRRADERFSLYGEIPGSFRADDTGDVLSLSLVDISLSGLGVLSLHKITLGQKITLHFEDQSLAPLHFECRYSREAFLQPVAGLKVPFRSGLKLLPREGAETIFTIFTRFETVVIGD